MFLSREIDIKLCQIDTKTHIYAILYKSCSIKQILKPKNSGLLLLQLFLLLVTWFPSVSCRQRYCTDVGWSSCDVIRTMRTLCYYIINYIYKKCKIKVKIIIGENLRFSGFCGILSFSDWLPFVKYDLFNSTTFIQNCIYMIFCITLRQFYINFSRQEH